MEFEGEETGACPLTLVEDDTGQTLQMYSYHLKGLLPVQGGVLDQTSQYLQAMSVIAQAVEENQEDSNGGN